jgi:hypothetical protein
MPATDELLRANHAPMGDGRVRETPIEMPAFIS